MLSLRRFITACALLACVLSPASSFAADPQFTSRFDDDIRGAVHRYWGDAPIWTWWKAQLYQESNLDPSAVSPVGAAGIAQFMPGTWADITGRLGWQNANPHSAQLGIQAGAFYMAFLRNQWTSKRELLEQHRLAQASYNAGTGNILKAQSSCGGALLWSLISPCLAGITGQANARQTIDYVNRIARWQGMMTDVPVKTQLLQATLEATGAVPPTPAPVIEVSPSPPAEAVIPGATQWQSSPSSKPSQPGSFWDWLWHFLGLSSLSSLASAG